LQNCCKRLIFRSSFADLIFTVLAQPFFATAANRMPVVKVSPKNNLLISARTQAQPVRLKSGIKASESDYSKESVNMSGSVFEFSHFPTAFLRPCGLVRMFWLLPFPCQPFRLDDQAKRLPNFSCVISR